MAGVVTSASVPENAPAQDENSGVTAPESQPGTGEQPQLILGKFKTVEELAASYTELQKKLGAQPKTGEPKPEEKPADAAPTAEEVAAAEKKGIDFDALDREYRESGKLSDETVAALEKAGFPKSRIEQHLAGIKALQDQMEARMATAVGGPEQLKSILEWGAKNLPDADADMYDAAVNTGNEALIAQALQVVKQKYEAATGVTPKLLNGDNVPSAVGVKPFSSQDEIARAMSDPRYQEGDAAYHAEVQARLRASYNL